MGCVDWTAVAPSWDRQRSSIEQMKASLTAQLLAGLGPLAGRTVLELGAGTGELAARLADAVGDAGRVVASDAAEGMVALLRERLAGRANVEVARLDAAAIERPEASVDAVVFRMGPMLLPDPGLGLREARRVLRPGGRFAAATWAGPQENPWLTSLGMAAMMHGLVAGGPPVGPGGPFSLADPDELGKLLRDAGFTDVAVTRVPVGRRFAGVDDYLATVGALTPALAAALAGADAGRFAELRGTLTGMLERFADGGALSVPGMALACVAA